MRRSILLLLALAAAMPAAQAAGLPGQASRYCALPDAAVRGAAASDRSPYLGIFDGKWDRVLPVTLIVYEVKGNRAKAYYAWKDYAGWQVKAGCHRAQGRIVNGMLQFYGADTMSFTPRGNGLNGAYIFQPGKPAEFVEHSRFSRKR